MGLFSTTYNQHSHDNSTSINLPDTIKVHEHRAPTEESIRLMEDAHDKAMKNIIAKVKVEDNLVNGECYLIEQPWNINDLKLIFKFSINGKEFNLEKQISRHTIGWENEREISHISRTLKSDTKAIIIWYVLKMFTAFAYEQIVGEKFPEQLLK